MTPIDRADLQDQFLDVIDAEEARRRWQAALRLAPLGVEVVPLAAALGRVLASDVAAQVDVPPFDRANVDGFAVRAADTCLAREDAPCRLRLTDEIIATGVLPRDEVGPGMAATIATGGVLPRGADAVVMVEHADLEDAQLLVRKAVAAGDGLTFAGTDIAAGETLLRRGQQLSSRETGVLAAIGVDPVAVWRRPRVAVVSTGDELAAPGQPLRPGQVFDSNGTILCDAVGEVGGLAEHLGIVPDDLHRLGQRLQQALRDFDLVLLSGGTSKGAGDLCYRSLCELTDPGIVVHGVALKPGKPLCLAASGGKPVVVLPGFPTSAIFTFHEFVAPVIRRLAGRGGDERATRPARLAVQVNSQLGRTEYLLVGLVRQDTDPPDKVQLEAFPMGKGSGSVTTFSSADGFVTIPRNTEIVPAGSIVTVQLLGRDLRPADLVVMGSHCMGLDLLLGRLLEQGVTSRLLVVGSTAGLEAARRGACDVAGVHLLDPATGIYNRPFLTDNLELIEGYERLQGLAFRPGDVRFADRDTTQMVAAAAADPTCRMVNRNAGSGTRVLIDRLLQGAQPPGYAVQASSHTAVAAAIVQGRADWGVTIETAARRARLDFVGLAHERFDFVVPRSRAERPAVQLLRKLLADPDVRRDLAALGFGRRAVSSGGALSSFW